MKRYGNIYLILLLTSAAPISVFSDLKIKLAKECELPFALSPLNFSNSSSKFSNSVSNFNNSSVKFSNTSTQFDNSPSNFENGDDGNRRLLIERGGRYSCIGYYVFGDDSLINFFSLKGKRLFYKPSGTDAIFSGETGEFCGTLATYKNERILVVTEKGQETFNKEGIELYQPEDIETMQIQQYPSGSGHWIQENIDGGSIIILDDGSLWKIDPIDKIEAMLWLPVAKISVITSMSGPPGYDYMLIHADDGEKVRAKYLGKK